MNWGKTVVLIGLIGGSALADQGKGTKGFVGRFEMTREGAEKAIKHSLALGIPRLEAHMQNYVIPGETISISPSAATCSSAAFANMGIQQAWTHCWGIPEFFFGSWIEFFSGAFLNFYWPRPAKIQASHAMVRHLKFKNSTVVCANDGCGVRLFVDSALLTANVHAEELLSTREIFPAQDVAVSIANAETPPSFDLFLRLDPQADDLDATLRIDPTRSALSVAAGSVRFEIKGQEGPAERANNYLFGIEYFNTIIVGLVESALKEGSVAALNRTFEPLFKPFEFSLPNWDIQNLVDQPKLAHATQHLHKTLIDFKQRIDQTTEFKLKKVKDELIEIMEPARKVIGSHSLSTNTTDLSVLQAIKRDIAATCAAALSYADKCKRDSHTDKRLDEIHSHCNDTQQRIDVVSKDLAQRARAKLAKGSVELATNHGPSNGNPLSYAIVSQGLHTTERVHDFVTNSDTPHHDFSFQISVAAMNDHLERLHRDKVFDFCINYTEEHVTCGAGEHDLEVRLVHPPVVRWSSERNLLYLDAFAVESKVKTPGLAHLRGTMIETPQIKFFFNPQPGKTGVLFNLEVASSMQIEANWSKARTAINKLKKMTIVHPMVAHYVMGVKVENKLEKLLADEMPIKRIDFGNGLALPPLRVEQIVVDPSFIKVYGSF